ncbi:MAG: SPASM domain-containing protein, partial [Desulfocurvibacter africanus]
TYLQGWGEPLLHPELPRIVARLTEAGAKCALTSNGTQLTPELGRELLAAGLAAITVSVSGAREETHAKLRPPSSLDDILSKLARFRELARARPKPPRIGLSFLQQPENVAELPEFVALTRRHSLEECIAVNATYLPTDEHAGQVLAPDKAADRASRKALFASILRRQSFQQVGYRREEQAECLNLPTRNISIGVGGDVSPCIFLRLPLRSMPAGFDRALLCFGNILEEDLAAIWAKPDYQAFRKTFERRRTFSDHCLDGVERGFGALEALRKADERERAFFAEQPAPDACRGCLKLQGL